ncbi:reverse transcriptase domain-containing protein [Tanacetum coccineum]|uniref:Reverse transcriptase domain-containing protein n=1 Tax=Tanacetum coccineum TaxID=301880 RepID=A0ABQ5J823_9ASTR
MDPNQIDDERNNFFEVDDETDVWFMMKAYEYNQRLEEEQNQPRLIRNPIHRDREDGERRLMADYFDDYCKYPLYYFRRRYRMSRKLFLNIVEGIKSYVVDPLSKHFKFLTHRPDTTGQMSMIVIMKCTSAIRQLAYGNTPHAFDEYLQMGEHTARNCLDNFNKCIFDLYMSKYLRKLTLADVEKMHDAHENILGFPGMLGSIGCMHWEWKNYAKSWEGQYACANNDINVLDNSPLFDDLLDDIAHVALFVVNDAGFEKGYYFADGIYPQWETFVKSFSVANDEKHSFFKRQQESLRKDVERAFGVLQGHWGIIQQPARQYHVNKIRRIMYSSIIMHNMILEDQKIVFSDWNEMYANPIRNMQCTWIERCDV